MEDLLKVLNEKLGDILTILLFSLIGFAIYMLAHDGPIKARIKGAALGFCISMAFSYPAYLVFGYGQWWVLAAIPSSLTIAGQFLPELIQVTLQKFAKNVSNKITEKE